MSDFGKEVAKEYRGFKAAVDGKNPRTDTNPGGIDPQVREQIRADLDKLIEKNDPPK